MTTVAATPTRRAPRVLGTMFVVALLFIVYYNLLSAYVARRQDLVLKRLRFARDLHDVTVRDLSVIAVKAKLVSQLAERGDGGRRSTGGMSPR